MLRFTRLPRSILIPVIIFGSTYASDLPFTDLIHPDSGIFDSIADINDEHLENALAAACDELTEIGANEILICRFHRIEAPLGGYLIDGLFRLQMDGNSYTTFRIGIEDDESIFTFIIRGTGTDGSTVYYPKPGPDYIHSGNQPVPEGYMEYEFLLNREEFETLEIEFIQPGNDNSGQ